MPARIKIKDAPSKRPRIRAKRHHDLTPSYAGSMPATSHTMPLAVAIRVIENALAPLMAAARCPRPHADEADGECRLTITEDDTQHGNPRLKIDIECVACRAGSAWHLDRSLVVGTYALDLDDVMVARLVETVHKDLWSAGWITDPYPRV